ncbi:alpha/beta hydrolase fold protein, partial [mine drainage metagenome]
TNPNEHVLRSIVYSRIEGDYLNKDRLSEIGVQTLIIWGEQDMMIPVKFAHTLNSSIKNSELFVIKGAKHTPHYTNPKEVADKVLQFLAQSKKIL